MPFRHGKGTVFKLGTFATPSTLVDLSTYLTEVTFPRPVDTAETSAFGTTAKTYVVGLTDATLSLSGMFDAVIDAQLAALLGFDNNAAGVSFEYGPEGSTTGRIRYTGACIITSYQVSGSIGAMVSATAAGQVTGAVTRGTYP